MALGVAQLGQNSSLGTFLANQPADSPPARGLETTLMLQNAKKFADQAAVNAWVTSFNGPSNTWFWHQIAA